ncbi:MAG: glycerophosphodiester phosphodiesterase family protein [Mucilaginibacter sp.]|uniref:glycerophosphodiester phosphodiesterase family protein n=1 Tax=Mucilaginibacter sp. TaxID=1882438 RepID=UPI003565D0C0
MANYKNILYAGVIAASVIALCSFNSKNVSKYPSFFKIGHRGTRGMMPENTIPAMQKAINYGVNTIEFDVHVTKDGKVIVYHDDSFDPNYTLMPNGTEIDPKARDKYLFYQMDYADIKPFIIGTKKYPAFPQQQSLPTYTPLLSELVDSVEHYTKANNLPQVYYLLEIKSDAKTDGVNQPVPEVFVKKVMDVMQTKKLGKRLIVQSFDKRPLKVMHQNYPEVATGFLTGDNKVSFEKNMAELGYTPRFYNPHYGMVSEQLVKQCHDKQMLICPWTVNETAEMKRLAELKVDGIITDYPNHLSELIK